MGKFGSMIGLALLCATGAMAQGIQGVHPASSPLQVAAEYTFIDFNETPHATHALNGGEGSVSYYRDWIGVEGDVSDAFASVGGKTGQVLFGGGGLRVRWQRPSSFEPWAHVLAGAAHISPKTFSDSTEFGFKAGGGIDLHPQHGPVSIRVSADLIGTQFFGTYQMSPEISAGVVFAIGRH